MVSKSIERAQKKVEENNFGIRKRLLEYDDVMNAQRKAIYKKRRNALFGDRLDLDTDNLFYDVADSIVYSFGGTESYHEFELELLRVLGIQAPLSEDEYKSKSKEEITELVYQAVRAHYDRKNQRIAERAWPQIKGVFETPGNQYKNIRFELTDGRKLMGLIVNLEEAYNSNGKAIGKGLERSLTLGLIDNEWKEHLREMDDLRQAVHNAQYEQKDPLLIYKLESFELFKAMMSRLNQETVESLLKMDIPEETQAQSTNKEEDNNHYSKAQVHSNQSATEAPRFQGSQGYQEAMQSSNQQVMEKAQAVVADPKIGRNAPCPYGSGKKYKQCHGK
jgi:preprotein translocase subunit SecA